MRRLFTFLFLFSIFGLSAQMKTVHVLVALCDNTYQGIVKVPAKIGNGQDPGNNLYWGCGYGVKTFLKKQTDWKLIKSIKDPAAHIYERLVFKHKTSNTYLVADAYDGSKMKETLTDFFDYSSGHQKKTVSADSLKINAGGSSDLICFVGHNGLMDLSLDSYPQKADDKKREMAIYACASKGYFKTPLQKSGATPLIWTTNLMCPEAYSLVSTLNGWLKKESGAAIRESVAQTYASYHKCGIKGARNLFATGW
jgi:hypothetical protein